MFSLKPVQLATATTFLALFVCAAGTTKKSGGATEGYKGWDAESSYVSLYKQGHDTILTGRVVKVSYDDPMPGMGKGTILLIKATDNTKHTVSLGPKAYLDEKNIAFKPGEEVTVKGSSVDLKGKTVIFANEINRAGIGTNALIDETGRPVWEGDGK